MAQNKIKVYARLKKESKLEKLVPYEVVNTSNEDLLNFYSQTTRNVSQKFRFNEVFDVNASQKQLFEVIAKPIINGVLSGYNGTIFAYGPTGSGKTYSLTGSHNKYHNRGLIPRAIEYIFKDMANSENEYSIYISYLEIYNEIAYDLLNPKECISTIEELPRVVLLEDDKGEAHFKNLSLRLVHSEAEAMEQLFLGDSNRTTAETPINVYSSRSHSIFSIHITAKNKESFKIRKSKLNLVDLAGSERIFKTNLNGITLSEAKYINLSLYYLEQVILAISESKRVHVPFRNSIMTFMLRDSLSGQSLTSMLTTLSVERNCIDETLSACKFAQRVSMIKTSTVLHNEIDPQVEIATLRKELVELHKKYKLLEQDDKPLTKSEENECKQWVKKYLDGIDESPLVGKAKIKYCYTLLREEVKEKSLQNSTIAPSIELKYKQIIKQKEEEISILLNTICNVTGNKDLVQGSSMDILNKNKVNIEGLFNEYMVQTDSKKTLSCCINCINEMYATGRSVASKMIERQIDIQNIKLKLQTAELDSEERQHLRQTLKGEQYVYQKMLSKLSNLKRDIDYMRNSMTRTKIRILVDFKKWLLCKNVECSPDVVHKIDSRIERYLKQINGRMVDEQVELKEIVTDQIANEGLNNSGPCLDTSCLREIQNVIKTGSVISDKPSIINQPYKSMPGYSHMSNSKVLLPLTNQFNNHYESEPEVTRTLKDRSHRHNMFVFNKCGPYYNPSSIRKTRKRTINGIVDVCNTSKASFRDDSSKEHNTVSSNQDCPYYNLSYLKQDKNKMTDSYVKACENYRTDSLRNEKSTDHNVHVSNKCGPYYNPNCLIKPEDKMTYGDFEVHNISKTSIAENDRSKDHELLIPNKCRPYYNLCYSSKENDKMANCANEVCGSDSEEVLKAESFRNDRSKMDNLLGPKLNYLGKFKNKESNETSNQHTQESTDNTITESGDDKVQCNSFKRVTSTSSLSDEHLTSSGNSNASKEVEFLNFMKTVPMTGDADVDEEIIKFYKMKLLS